jgi:MFS family permease
MPDETSKTKAVVAPPATPLPRNVRLLGWASFLNDVSSEMIYPLLPTLVLRQLRGSLALLGAMEGLADAIGSFVKLYFGSISDRWKRRKPMVVAGYLLAALSRPFVATATLAWQLVPIRAVDRIGKGIRAAPRDAMMADCTAPGLRGRAFGFQRAMDHLGAALGPLLAFGFLLVWPGQLRLLILLAIIPALMTIALLAIGLRETPIAADPPSDAPPPTAGEATAPAKDAAFSFSLRPLSRRIRVLLLAVFLFTLGNSSDLFVLKRATDVGLPLRHVPLLWCLFHVVKSFGSRLSGDLIDRIGPRPLMVVGWTIYAVLFLAFGFAEAVWEIWVLMSCYAMFHALTEPAERTMVAAMVVPEHRGLAFGWYHFAVGIAALPASLVFGIIYQYAGAAWAFGWGAALAVIATVVLLSTGREP